MRNLFLTLMVVTLGFTSCNDDDNTVPVTETPALVVTAFNEKFPDATDIAFKKEENFYRVEFEVNTVDHKAFYTNTGVLVKYKYDIPPATLPPAIKATIKKDYENRKFDDTEILVENDNRYYQLELDKEPTDDKLVFNEDGTIVKYVIYWD